MSQPILDGTAVLATILGNIPIKKTIRNLERTMLQILAEEPESSHLSKHFPLDRRYGTSRSLGESLRILRSSDAIVNIGVHFNLDEVRQSTHNLSGIYRVLFSEEELAYFAKVASRLEYQ